MGTGELAKVIRRILKDDRKPQAIDTEAEVKRVEDGIAWVHIPGGVDETPVKLTIDAKKGDTVQVRVAKGRAWLVGNASRPPSDDAKANEAYSVAGKAFLKAGGAMEDAKRAQEAADSAEKSAENAQRSANIASEYASRALGDLSTVQSVSETLSWITQHGTMTQTTDTELDPSHVYFVRDENGDYVVGNVHYSIVAEPKETDLSSYYVLTIDESLNNYVATHLALTDEGLWVLNDENGWRLLIAGDGVSIIDGQGRMVAQYKNTITLGTNDGNQLNLTPDAIAFVIAGQTIAYIAQDKLMTTNAELTGALFVGDYYVRQKSNGKLAVGLRR